MLVKSACSARDTHIPDATNPTQALLFCLRVKDKSNYCQQIPVFHIDNATSAFDDIAAAYNVSGVALRKMTKVNLVKQ
ncbi:hypothetical protein MAM1_0035c02646 [Mucor ambiguus]|uniref:Uncharacterized protein n=1 Tax=Mucor ambiguus TaxID=91626 RepID=A0A0C9LSV4_9FUNG|nr:hypothetical protein MAM1_0035c02646 [Mucor ambiguus]